MDKGKARPSSERPRGSEEGHRFKEELASEVNGYDLRYPFSTVDKGEARPSSDRPRGSEEGHRPTEELAGEVNGYKWNIFQQRQRVFE